MQATNHINFIVAAYAAAAMVVGALLAWVLLDYRAQLRNLANLEKRGVTRRSAAAARSGSSIEQAKEDA
jgi:heme exporter protein D